MDFRERVSRQMRILLFTRGIMNEAQDRLIERALGELDQESDQYSEQEGAAYNVALKLLQLEPSVAVIFGATSQAA